MARIDPQYLPTARGARFVATWLPDAGSPDASILVVPPFAEELNKCRRMLALTGMALADLGWRVCLPDLGGTGDSEGAFARARVADWVDDLADAAAGCAAAGAPVRTVLAVRLGAALACLALPRLSGVGRLVLWQGVASGQQHLAQFLRLRVAGNIVGGGGAAAVTVGSLRAELAAGQTLEVAGYDLGPGLAADLDALRFAPPAGHALPALWWLEVSGADPPAVGPVASGQVEAWRQQGGTASAEACAGDPFWSTVEITTARGLVERTLLAIGAARA